MDMAPMSLQWSMCMTTITTPHHWATASTFQAQETWRTAVMHSYRGHRSTPNPPPMPDGAQPWALAVPAGFPGTPHQPKQNVVKYSHYTRVGRGGQIIVLPRDPHTYSAMLPPPNFTIATPIELALHQLTVLLLPRRDRQPTLAEIADFRF